MKTTLHLTPTEIEYAIARYVESRGYVASSVEFKIDRGFPRSKDPRESQYPTFTGCAVQAVPKESK